MLRSGTRSSNSPPVRRTDRAAILVLRGEAMKLPRRKFLYLSAGAAALPRVAFADTYPSRAVRMMVGSTPGASPDLVARLFGQWLSEKLGQPFVIDNRPAGGGNLAAEPVVRAPPDGYMLLVFSASTAIDMTLLAGSLNYDLDRDIAPVGGFIDLPMLLLVNPAFPAKTLPEFIAYAKANPGKVNIGTPPVGSPQYVSAALLEMMSETKLAVIPYRGGPAAVTDALGGQIQGVMGTVLCSSTRSKLVRSARSRSLRRSALNCCRMCRRWPKSCRAIRRANGSASARRRTRRPRSSPSLTPRSMPRSPIRESKRNWSPSEACRCRDRPISSANSLPARR